MVTLGYLVVAPEERRAVWTLARADVESAATDGGMACEEFMLLGHTWSLHLYPDTESSTGPATTAPCSIMVESREKGPVQATIALNGVAQTLSHVFGSGARAILRWPGAGSDDSSAPMALEVSFSLSSVGDEASKRAAGEISVVQQLEQLKVDKAELQVQVSTLSDETGRLAGELSVSEAARTTAESKVEELSALVATLEAKAAGLEEAANQAEALRAALAEQQSENERITSEKSTLQEELRDLHDDHDTLTQRFAVAQELKAKSEVVAYHAETAKASLDDQYKGQIAGLEAKIDAVQTEKVSLEGEVSKLRPEVAGLTGQKQRLEQQAKVLQEERDAVSSQVQTMQAESENLRHRVQDLENTEGVLKTKIDEYEKKKKKKGMFG